jgi:intracellular sulfur oxidation DsrE/DsrF family protein
MRNLPIHRRSVVRALAGAMMIAVVLSMVAPAVGAEPAPLPDKPFAEHRIVLQLSDDDPKKQSLVISVAYNLLKLYDPDKVAIEVVAFGPGIDLLFPDNANRQRIESLVAQGVKFDICLNTVDTIERETGKRPQYIPAAIPVQVGVGQILALTENGYTLVRP